MPRQARLDSPGTLHHVMVRGIEQRQIVNDEADRAEERKPSGPFTCGEKEDSCGLVENY